MVRYHRTLNSYLTIPYLEQHITVKSIPAKGIYFALINRVQRFGVQGSAPPPAKKTAGPIEKETLSWLISYKDFTKK
jgi:hypothetical protein